MEVINRNAEIEELIDELKGIKYQMDVLEKEKDAARSKLMLLMKENKITEYSTISGKAMVMKKTNVEYNFKAFLEKFKPSITHLCSKIDDVKVKALITTGKINKEDLTGIRVVNETEFIRVDV